MNLLKNLKDWMRKKKEMKKNLFVILVLISLAGFFPGLALSADLGGNFGIKGGMRQGSIDPTDPKVQVVHCRLNRLTDLVFPGKIEEVVMSDPSDFKLATIRHKSRTHLVLKPLKDSTSDLFVFGVNYVRYLRLKAVSKGQDYQVRIYARRDKRAPHP